MGHLPSSQIQLGSSGVNRHDLANASVLERPWVDNRVNCEHEKLLGCDLVRCEVPHLKRVGGLEDLALVPGIVASKRATRPLHDNEVTWERDSDAKRGEENVRAPHLERVAFGGLAVDASIAIRHKDVLDLADTLGGSYLHACELLNDGRFSTGLELGANDELTRGGVSGVGETFQSEADGVLRINVAVLERVLYGQLTVSVA